MVVSRALWFGSSWHLLHRGIYAILYSPQAQQAQQQQQQHQHHAPLIQLSLSLSLNDMTPSHYPPLPSHPPRVLSAQDTPAVHISLPTRVAIRHDDG